MVTFYVVVHALCGYLLLQASEEYDYSEYLSEIWRRDAGTELQLCSR